MILGAPMFAGRMRKSEYVTMLDPFQNRYNGLVVVLLYLASLAGDLFWSASILAALGISTTVYSGGSRISRWGGANLQCVHFLVKTYVKTKEIDPVGGGGRAGGAPGSANGLLYLIVSFLSLKCIQDK